MMDLLVIADHRDLLAGDLGGRVARRGWRVERLDYAQASRRISIERGRGPATVLPALPIFLRLPRGGGAWDDDEAQFHAAERRSLIWAAAALTPVAVVNRPDGFGLASRALASGEVLRRRAGLDRGSIEILASSCPSPPAAGAGWWTESLRERVPLPWPSAAGKGPFRGGYVRDDLDRNLVVVAGERTIGAPGDSLACLSRMVCNALGLGFAALTWTAREGEAELVHVDPHPRPEHVAGHEEEVVDGLLEILAA